MTLKLLKAFLFISLFAYTFGSFCPSGSVKVQKFTTLTSNQFQHSSTYYDAMYSLKTDTTGSTTLNGYKLTKSSDIATPSFEVSTFSLTASETWSIVSISQNGNCVIIDQGVNVTAYQTSSNTFKLTQTIHQQTYTTIQQNQDCSIVRVTIADVEKVYKNSNIDSSILFAKNSIFDSYLTYGIDSTKSLNKYSAGSFNKISLDSGLFEDVPVSIINRKDINALIIVTNSSTTNRVSLVIIDTTTDKKVYAKAWASTEYNGSVSVERDNQANFVLVRDKSAFLWLLDLQIVNSTLAITQIPLEKATYNPVFASSGAASLNPDLIITYANKKLSYFQKFNNILYYIGQLSADLEVLSDQFTDKTKMSSFVPTMVSPSQLSVCYPAATTNTSESDIANSLQDSTVQTVLDASGATVKCQPECLKCKLGGLCEICSLGYILSDAGACVYCDGCRSCNPLKPQICYGCFKPQVIDPATNKCVDPVSTDPNCESVLLDGSCQSCFKGYSIHDSICSKCPEGCQTCKASATQCDKGVCQLGFVFYQDPTISTKYFCVQCASGCMSCSLDDITNCTQCNDGFFGVKQATTGSLRCTGCMDNCRSCINSTNCDRCSTGYRLNNDKTKCLENCDDKCSTCSDTDKTACLSCYSGSKLSAGACVADLTCNASKTCTGCSDGYALSNGGCLSCTYTDSNCVGCSTSNLTTCLKCKTGFYLNSARTCVQCLAACAGCLNENACFSCNKGYYISKLADSVTGKCLKCDNQCLTCNQYGYLCTSCYDNATLDGFKCKSLNNVEFSATVGASASQFVSIAKQFVQSLIDSANALMPSGSKQLSAKDVILKKLQGGSLIISGSLSTNSQSATASVASGLSNDLATKSIGGFPVLGVSSVAVKTQVPSKTPVTPVTPTTTDTTPTASSSNIGLILGIAIPLGIIFIVGIGFIIFKLMKNRSEWKTDSGKVDSQDLKDSIKSMVGHGYGGDDLTEKV